MEKWLSSGTTPTACCPSFVGPAPRPRSRPSCWRWAWPCCRAPRVFRWSAGSAGASNYEPIGGQRVKEHRWADQNAHIKSHCQKKTQNRHRKFLNMVWTFSKTRSRQTDERSSARLSHRDAVRTWCPRLGPDSGEIRSCPAPCRTIPHGWTTKRRVMACPNIVKNDGQFEVRTLTFKHQGFFQGSSGTLPETNVRKTSANRQTVWCTTDVPRTSKCMQPLKHPMWVKHDLNPEIKTQHAQQTITYNTITQFIVQPVLSNKFPSARYQAYHSL